MSRKFFSSPFLKSDLAVLLCLAALKLLTHFLTNDQYGYHRDELLYIAVGEHPALGYIEVPPFIAVAGKFSRWLFGDSLFAIRFFPAVSGALMVLLTGLMARELGGGRFAQILASLAIVLSPAYLRSNTLFQPVPFDQLFWVLGAFLLVMIFKKERLDFHQSGWLWLGAAVGIGMLNKYSMLLFCFGLLGGLLLTPQRKILLTRWPWFGALLALLIFLPNLIWQINNDWPFLAHMQELSASQLVNVSPAGFLLGQLLMNISTFPIWLAGLGYYFLSKEGKTYRVLGWIYVAIFLLLLLLSGKDYYLLPAYPMLFASGALAIERAITQRKLNWLKPAIVTFMIVNSIVPIPYGLPLLPIETFSKYAQFMAQNAGLSGPLRWETGRIERLPQDYADMFGWEEQVATVAKVYHRLSSEEQSRCVIFAGNYGQAGAIDYFGHAYGLPKAVSVNGSYYLWGPGDRSGEITIIVGVDREDLEGLFDDIELAATITHEWARENNLPIYLCRGPKITLQEFWPRLKIHQF
jgi:4-amino-4-deoxy-L-arabinose transferase-like glycosyltransferase